MSRPCPECWAVLARLTQNLRERLAQTPGWVQYGPGIVEVLDHGEIPASPLDILRAIGPGRCAVECAGDDYLAWFLTSGKNKMGDVLSEFSACPWLAALRVAERATGPEATP